METLPVTLVTLNPKTIPNSTFFIAFHIFVVGDRMNLQIWCAGCLQVPVYGQQTVPEKVVVMSRDPV